MKKNNNTASNFDGAGVKLKSSLPEKSHNTEQNIPKQQSPDYMRFFRGLNKDFTGEFKKIPEDHILNAPVVEDENGTLVVQISNGR